MTNTYEAFTLEDLHMAVEEIIAIVRQKGIGEDFEDVATKAANHALKFHDMQKKYAYYVDEYLKLKEPFSWNRNGPPQTEEEYEERIVADANQFIDLIKYALWAGGDMEILNFWALTYPFSDNGPGLATSNRLDYVEILTNIMEDTSDTQQQKCLHHLITQLALG